MKSGNLCRWRLNPLLEGGAPLTTGLPHHSVRSPSSPDARNAFDHTLLCVNEFVVSSVGLLGMLVRFSPAAEAEAAKEFQAGAAARATARAT
jgi:hypothetical protein